MRLMEREGEKLSYTEKIPGRSIQAVRQRYDEALHRQKQARRISFGARKAITAEAFTNAIILHFLDLDEEKQDAILGEYVPRFGRMCDEAAAEPEASRPGEVSPAVVRESPSAKPKRRTKGAG